MILRNAQNTDVPALRDLFKDWIVHDPSILESVDGISASDDTETRAHCRVLEAERSIRAVLLSLPEGKDRRRIAALAATIPWRDPWTRRFIEEQIMDWADLGIARVGFRVPATAEHGLLEILRSCGFFSEGVSTSLQSNTPARVHLCKHFLYQTLDEEDLLGFMKDVFTRLGYETRDEENAFGFRPSPTLLLPFLFSPWHRISRIARDIVLQPPVRRIELHELETAFYPLSIRGIEEKPLLLIMDAGSASRLIDLPQDDLEQGNLFARTTLCRPRTIHLSDITCTHPSAARLIRKGLPLLFYVHRIGAVGSARVDGWDMDEPSRLCEKFPHSDGWDPAEIEAHCATSGPLAGKMLAVRFHWFRPFKHAVSFERMRTMDESFHPQRTRTVSPQLFRAVVEAGGSSR